MKKDENSSFSITDDKSLKKSFSSNNASGSTSQAASIIEAVEVGARVLLMDEDTCATNFMIRDARMQALAAEDDEPSGKSSSRCE